VSKKSYTKIQDEHTHGGKREGAGRPDEGKKRYNVSLTEDNVTKAKAAEKNFSGLLDELLAKWLARRT
jgi:hypothetical protein